MDDLVQDTLERAVANKNKWLTETDLRAWLFTIMHNHFVNQHRRQQRTPTLVEIHEQTQTILSSQKAESALYLRDLENALNQPKPEEREILTLVAIEGMSYREVSEILSIPEGTVMSRLSRVREKLRDVLQHPKKASLREIK